MKALEDVDTRERQTVNFLCEVNQVDVDGRWYRDDCRIRPGDNIKIRHQGERQAHAGWQRVPPANWQLIFGCFDMG